MTDADSALRLVDFDEWDAAPAAPAAETPAPPTAPAAAADGAAAAAGAAWRKAVPEFLVGFTGSPEMPAADLALYSPASAVASRHDLVYTGPMPLQRNDFRRQDDAHAAARRVHPSHPMCAVNCAHSTEDSTFYMFCPCSFAGAWARTRAAREPDRRLFEQFLQPHLLPATHRGPPPLVSAPHPRAGGGTLVVFPCHPHIDIDAKEPGFDVDLVRRLFEWGWARVLAADGAGYTLADVTAITMRRFKPGKDSVHVVYHLPGNRMYYSNLHWGAVVRRACAAVMDALVCAGVPNERSPFVIPEVKDLKAGPRTVFVPVVDTGIYTRRRNFNLLDNTKPEREIAKRAAAAFYPMVAEGPAAAAAGSLELFCASMATFVRRDNATGEPVPVTLLTSPGEPLIDGDLLEAAGARLSAFARFIERPRLSARAGDEEAGGEASNGGTIYALARAALAAIDAEPGDDWSIKDVHASNGLVVLVKTSLRCVYDPVGQHSFASKMFIVGSLSGGAPRLYYVCQSSNCKPVYEIFGRKKEVPLRRDALPAYQEAFLAYMANAPITGVTFTSATVAAEVPASDPEDSDDDSDAHSVQSLEERARKRPRAGDGDDDDDG